MRVKDAVGRFGEDAAVRYLEDAGLRIVERNWRCREGEIDIVARDGPVLVFCEVKTRSGAGFGHPAEAVDRAKVARIRRLAVRWLAEHRPEHGDLRFDVVSVERSRTAPPRIVHLRGAF
ncbi:MAG: YraN family protein [Frankia sp.]